MASVVERMVRIGGGTLFLRRMGSGTPPVVISPGIFGTADKWADIQCAVAQFTTVVAYDRAGLGHSEPGLAPTTSGRMADDLHELLHAAGIAGPYVLVGHSLGGLNAQLFAAHYPDEVAGLVLIDSVVVGQEEWWEALLTGKGKALEGQRRFWEGENGEHVDFAASITEARAANWQTHAPLIVLTRGVVQPDEVSPEWPQEHERLLRRWWPYQRALAARSSQGQFRIAEESGHNIQRDQPGLVVAAIREVIEAVR